MAIDKVTLRKGYEASRIAFKVATEALNSAQAKRDKLNELQNQREAAYANLQCMLYLKELVQEKEDLGTLALGLGEGETGDFTVFPYRDLNDETVNMKDRFEFKRNGKKFCILVVPYDVSPRLHQKLGRSGYTFTPYQELKDGKY